MTATLSDRPTPAGLPDQLDHFIGGAWRPARTGHLRHRRPGDQPAYARSPPGDAADVERAAPAAHRAFTDGPWPRLPARARAKVLHRIADAIECRDERIAQLETFDTGLPITQARGQADARRRISGSSPT